MLVLVRNKKGCFFPKISIKRKQPGKQTKFYSNCIKTDLHQARTGLQKTKSSQIKVLKLYLTYTNSLFLPFLHKFKQCHGVDVRASTIIAVGYGSIPSSGHAKRLSKKWYSLLLCLALSK